MRIIEYTMRGGEHAYLPARRGERIYLMLNADLVSDVEVGEDVNTVTVRTAGGGVHVLRTSLKEFKEQGGF